MKRNEALEWLQEHDCYVGEYDGEDFVIVEPRSNDPVDAPLFFTALNALGIDTENYGYGDEYTRCDICGNIIRTSPTHATWTPDFWQDGRDGEILCKECTKANADDYFKWLAEVTAEGESHICLLDPKEHGFTKVIEDLEYGYHPYQNDDPRKLIDWANENDFEIAFDVRQNPFTVTFDVWLRASEALEYLPEKSVRATVNVEQIRKILLVSDSRYSHLRSQFREWPTPEDQMKAQLRRASKGE